MYVRSAGVSVAWDGFDDRVMEHDHSRPASIVRAAGRREGSGFDGGIQSPSRTSGLLRLIAAAGGGYVSALAKRPTRRTAIA